LDRLQFSLEDLEQLDRSDPRASHLILIAHGVRDGPLTWSRGLAELLTSRQHNDTRVLSVNWNPYSEDVFRCAVSAQRIGRKIGAVVAAQEQIDSLHLIGHSCGAFVVYGICGEVKSRSQRITIQSTYLDPLSVHGLYWDYGVDNFGNCADFADAYIDVEDDVPGSNQPLAHAFTVDVTEARIKNGINISAHNWPTVYYQLITRNGRAPRLHEDPSVSKRLQAGDNVSVNTWDARLH
ncbi:MAG: hypothetical protein WD356_02735, partial [Pseudomonadales bacterium]